MLENFIPGSDLRFRVFVTKLRNDVVAELLGVPAVSPGDFCRATMLLECGREPGARDLPEACRVRFWNASNLETLANIVLKYQPVVTDFNRPGRASNRGGDLLDGFLE